MFESSEPVADQRVVIHGISWEQYEGILERLGDAAGVRVAYYRGALEIMSPSGRHERIKSMFGRLVELFAVEQGVELVAAGSTTFRARAKEAGAEPDECYCLGAFRDAYPDIAFEVVLTSGGLRKLDIYGLLGVPEVWFWKAERFHLYELRAGTYVEVPRSTLVPALDLDVLLRFLERPDQTQAVREYRDLLRSPSR